MDQTAKNNEGDLFANRSCTCSRLSITAMGVDHLFSRVWKISNRGDPGWVTTSNEMMKPPVASPAKYCLHVCLSACVQAHVHLYTHVVSSKGDCV